MTHKEKIQKYLEKIYPKYATVEFVARLLHISRPIVVVKVNELRQFGFVEAIEVYSKDGRLAFRVLKK